MRREPHYFGEQELALLYIARKLKEALALEALLTEAGVEYAVEADTYRGGLVFQSERVGAFFYVLPGCLDSVRAVLQRGGYRPYYPSA